MPIHREKRALPFTPEQMFDLVLDVAKYPEFLPWCVATRVKAKDEGEAGMMTADMAVGFKMVKERYTSRITFERPEHIHVTDIGGPFRHLETDWRFYPDGDGCVVDFHIDFAFSSRLLEKVMGAVFAEAAERMMQAFVSRAETVYAG
ncbi:MAG: type II toxin-antitoxin system RatA family toxin [Alphaproteobacteria bacterium]|nr:type II toxin-antitoxin system RatA family toxin [Alphaproteobacteria bacterium]MBF0248990.1 type II toxin-antitoxin system RatA family toxin [Alphaproteobacteria bacterium]